MPWLYYYIVRGRRQSEIYYVLSAKAERSRGRWRIHLLQVKVSCVDTDTLQSTWHWPHCLKWKCLLLVRPKGGRAVIIALFVDLNHVLLEVVAFMDFTTSKNSGFGCLFFIRIHSVGVDLVESFDKKTIFDLQHYNQSIELDETIPNRYSMHSYDLYKPRYLLRMNLLLNQSDIYFLCSSCPIYNLMLYLLQC